MTCEKCDGLGWFWGPNDDYVDDNRYICFDCDSEEEDLEDASAEA